MFSIESYFNPYIFPFRLLSKNTNDQQTITDMSFIITKSSPMSENTSLANQELSARVTSRRLVAQLRQRRLAHLCQPQLRSLKVRRIIKTQASLILSGIDQTSLIQQEGLQPLNLQNLEQVILFIGITLSPEENARNL